jgi:hypothetical protein
MDAIWWAGAFIWIGLALGAEYLDILPRVGDSAEWWPWIFIGIGPWALVLNVYRQTSSWPSPLTWDWIWTAIFLLVGLGAVMDIGEEIVGAVALVVVGVILMGRALSRRE